MSLDGTERSTNPHVELARQIIELRKEVDELRSLIASLGIDLKQPGATE